MPDPKRLDEARQWLRYAAEDLEAAEVLMAAPSPKARQALFHAQQTVEKALKAFLISNNRKYPLTHSLNVLLDLCAEMDPALRPTAGPALRLTQFAARFRYPGEEEEPGMQEAREGIAAARAVYLAVSDRLSQPG